MLSLVEKIKYIFKKPEIFPEAAIAYYNRIPDKIQVEWFRDGKYIIGRIIAGDCKFMTQAVSAKEFVDMVNDALFAVYNIPKEYFDILSVHRLYPPQAELNKLNNETIQKSTLSLQKILLPA